MWREHLLNGDTAEVYSIGDFSIRAKFFFERDVWFVCLCVVFVPLESLSLKQRRHHCLRAGCQTTDVQLVNHLISMLFSCLCLSCVDIYFLLIEYNKRKLRSMKTPQLNTCAKYKKMFRILKTAALLRIFFFMYTKRAWNSLPLSNDLLVIYFMKLSHLKDSPI